MTSCAIPGWFEPATIGGSAVRTGFAAFADPPPLVIDLDHPTPPGERAQDREDFVLDHGENLD
jgi:predicted acylesterase/phospholipase RssA